MATTDTTGGWSWFKETWQRIWQKSPGYFNVWAKIYGFIVIVPQIPVMLTEAGISLPTAFDTVANKIISIAGIIGFFMSKLTVSQATSVASNPATNLLPFTADHPVANTNAVTTKTP